MGTGRPRLIKTPEEMDRLWEEYKIECDNHKIITHEFSQRLSDFVSKELNKPITYTIVGFSVYLGMSVDSFYATYINGKSKELFHPVVTRIRADCEYDVRRKFETGTIPSQLSGLWMSKHGYSTNVSAEVKAELALVDDWVDAVVENEDSDILS